MTVRSAGSACVSLECHGNSGAALSVVPVVFSVHSGTREREPAKCLEVAASDLRVCHCCWDTRSRRLVWRPSELLQHRTSSSHISKLAVATAAISAAAAAVSNSKPWFEYAVDGLDIPMACDSIRAIVKYRAQFRGKRARRSRRPGLGI